MGYEACDDGNLVGRQLYDNCREATCGDSIHRTDLAEGEEVQNFRVEIK